jgi:hypothetical protein
MRNGFKMLQFNGVCEVPNIINASQCVYPPGPPSVRPPPSGPVWPPHPPPPPSGPLRLAPSALLWRPPFCTVWPQQPRHWAPSAPSVRPCLLLSTNNYKFFQVFVSQCLSCVRSLKSVASLDVVPLHETHFTMAFGQGSQS